jgi:pyruvate/2-oxoglutarate dehydrogenase complex dihydrolipoamide acyltransferase (E2) component
MLSATDRAALRSTLHFWCPVPEFTAACVALDPSCSRLAVVTREVAQCLVHHPRLNATLRDDRVCVYRDVNVGFAVDMGRGLKVLTLRSAEQSPLESIVESIDELMVKYVTDSLLPADVTGSTFTITDLGGDGVFAFIPLLNADQSAILGLGSESTLAGSPGFMLSCSFDHRILGGKQVADFLKDLSCRLVEFAAGLRPAPEEPCCSRCLRTVADVRRADGFLLSAEEPKGLICSLCLGGS